MAFWNLGSAKVFLVQETERTFFRAGFDLAEAERVITGVEVLEGPGGLSSAKLSALEDSRPLLPPLDGWVGQIALSCDSFENSFEDT